MNDILNRLTVLLALGAFVIIAAAGMTTGVDPMVCLFRATVALVFFGFFGRLGIRVVLKGILEELARHKQGNAKEETEHTDMKSSAQTAGGTTNVTEKAEQE